MAKGDDGGFGGMSQVNRIYCDSTKGIKREWERAHFELRDDLEATRGRKLGSGPMLNAIVLYYTRHFTRDEQLTVVRVGLEELEKQLAAEEAAAKKKGPGGVAAPKVTKVRVKELPPKGSTRQRNGVG